MVAILGLITILANFLVYNKQKADLEKAKKELKEDLAHIQTLIEKGYSRVSEDVGTMVGTAGSAREAARNDAQAVVKHIQDIFGVAGTEKNSNLK